MDKIVITKMLPKNIVEAIRYLKLSRIMEERCYKLAAVLLNKGLHDGRDFSKYQLLSTKYLEKAFGKRFNKQFFNRLRSSNIIECNRMYNQSRGIPYGYRLNQSLMQGDWIIVHYQDTKRAERPRTNFTTETISNEHIDKYLITFSKNCQVSSSSFSSPVHTTHSSSSHISSISSNILLLHINTYLFQNAIVTDDLSSLHYDKEKIMACMENKIRSICQTKLIINDDVKESSFRVYNQLQGWSYHTTKEKALAWAHKNGGDLIQDNTKFYLAHSETYIERRKQNYKVYERWFLSHLEQGHFYANRNTTNYRLDHNLTSASEAIMNVIKEDNQLIEIDLRNSQFAIHALWLKSDGLDSTYEDVEEYCKICAEGLLYETLAKKLNVPRVTAKNTMMSLSFSATNNNTKEKQLFKSRFPNVVQHVDDFKKKHKSTESFAIELQQWESEIFIDNLYVKLKMAGLFCLTKHDSLLVKNQDRNIVLSIVNGFFKEIGFKCALNIN